MKVDMLKLPHPEHMRSSTSAAWRGAGGGSRVKREGGEVTAVWQLPGGERPSGARLFWKSTGLDGFQN